MGKSKLINQFFRGIFASFILWAVIFPVTTEANQAPLRPNQAFSFSIEKNQGNVSANWKIAPGYYLYRDKFQFSTEPQATVDVQYPKPEVKNDKQKTREVYLGNLKIPLTIHTDSNIIKLKVDYQGCSSDGFCYPPMHQMVTLDIQHNENSNSNTPTLNTLLTDQSKVLSLLHTEKFGMMLLLFVGLGLLLAFTPCILPMVPILTGIIVGHKQPVTTKRAFLLSSTYVLGMSIAYALAGLMVAALGQSLQVWLQNPWAIGLGSLLFFVLALSMFGFFNLQLPRYWHSYVAYWSYKQEGGSYSGVFFMGLLSTLIVSPCVTAPLVGVLIYIAQTGDKFLGAAALFAMGIGMGMPLILVGVSARHWLPKSGPWMEAVKKSFGFIMVAVGIWLLSRIVPLFLVKTMWTLFIIGIGVFVGVYLSSLVRFPVLSRIAGVFIVIASTLPFVYFPFNGTQSTELATGARFVVVHDLKAIDKHLAAARQSQLPVIIDFFADWCESCLEMDKNVFAQPAIQKALSGFILLRVDITKNSDKDQTLLKYFDVIAPPTMLFFDAFGKEVTARRIVGQLSEGELLSRINFFYAEGCDRKASC